MRVHPPVAQALGVARAPAALPQPPLPAAAAASLPHAATAHRVELVTRFGVAEVMRPHSHTALATEERLDHVEQRPFQVADREALIDGKSLQLHEIRKVSRVEVVAAVHATR